MENVGTTIKSLHKALNLLEYFDDDHKELSIAELCRMSGLQKSSVHKMLQTFMQNDFIQKTGKGQYTLGKKVLQLSRHFIKYNTPQQILKIHMEEIAQITGENVYFAIPYKTDIIYIDHVSSKNTIITPSIQGTTAPMSCTAMGKAIIAFSGEQLLNEVLSRGLVQSSDNSIVDPDAFRKELSLIRNQGYSFDNMEHIYGIRCVAVPLLNNGEVIGALSVSGPSLRFSPKKIAEYAVLLKGIQSKLSF